MPCARHGCYPSRLPRHGLLGRSVQTTRELEVKWTYIIYICLFATHDFVWLERNPHIRPISRMPCNISWGVGASTNLSIKCPGVPVDLLPTQLVRHILLHDSRCASALPYVFFCVCVCLYDTCANALQFVWARVRVSRAAFSKSKSKVMTHDSTLGRNAANQMPHARFPGAFWLLSDCRRPSRVDDGRRQKGSFTDRRLDCWPVSTCTKKP